MNTRQFNLGCVLLCSLFSATAAAEKWYWEPVFTAISGFDDNVRLEASDPESVFSLHLDANARFGFRTEVSDIEFRTALKTHQYDGADDLDYNEALIGVDASLRRNLDTMRLMASILRDSSRTSELETTGFVDTSIPRTQITINPEWSRRLSERSLLRLGFTHTAVDYENTPGTTLTDYRFNNFTVGLDYKLSETTALQLTMLGNHYTADEFYSKFDSIALQAGLSHRFSETLSAAAALGVRNTHSFFINPVTLERDEERDLSSLISFSFRKEWEKTTLEGAFTTLDLPGGEGRMLNREGVTLGLKHRINERLEFTLDGIYIENKSAGGIVNAADSRTYYLIEPGLSWRISRWWTVTGSYRYRAQENRVTNSGLADSNALYLNLQYIWPRPWSPDWKAL